MSPERLTDLPIEPLFLQRWSPRAYQPVAMAQADLLTILEAARWAPSAYNIQPWRFVYVHRDDEEWQNFLGLLDPFNQSWAQRASALVVVLSDTQMPRADGKTTATDLRSHSFDTGAAWAQLALQATALGYQAHAMAGIDFDRIRTMLKVPIEWRIEIAVAIGKSADPTVLPHDLQHREVPSQRRPLDEIAFAGSL